MAFEGDGLPDRAYPYRSGWQVACCAVVFFGLLGSIGVSLVPVGYEKIQNGQLPTGIALLVMGIFGIPTLVMSFLSLAAGIRDAIRPPLLRVSPTALHLPESLRGEPCQDEDGLPIPGAGRPHPDEIPFTAIRWVRRDGPPFNRALEIAHDLSASPLRIEPYMMRAADFDEFDAVLQAAIPAAFAYAPPVAQTD